MENNGIVMHIDVNSAFLSWHAAYNKQIGMKDDIRLMPAVIGGRQDKRRGIVLAKSIIAKNAGVKTGESLMEARKKCPGLIVILPKYDIYVRAGKALREFLYNYTPHVEVFSIDECFLGFYGTENFYKDYEKLAYEIKEKIKKDFGYTVNIGISTNKLLAKQAGELEKPDKVHTLYPCEIEEKLWPLPVEELFMVGRKTVPKLNKIGIYTIGDLAKTKKNVLQAFLKSHGLLIHDYANGIDNSVFGEEKKLPFKGVGNGSTLPYDVTQKTQAYGVILSLTETASARLREENLKCRVISIGIKNKDFIFQRKQRKLPFFTDSTYELYENLKRLFNELWDGSPIRHMEVRFTDLQDSIIQQINFFRNERNIKLEKLDKVIDDIRRKHGKYKIVRGSCLENGLNPLMGGYPEDDYPNMTSIL